MARHLSLLANPAVFMRVTKPIVPIAWALGVIGIGIGTMMAFFFSPPDHRQGEAVRMMYVHVPAAWLALQTYALMAVASFVGYVWRHRIADIAARVAAPIGLAFTALALVTGALWGKVTWGVYWDWDPRLTSMLILLFLYAGYIAIWMAFEDPVQAARMAALVAMLGAINLPIIKFSVDWWDSLHQKAAVIREGGPSMPASMLWPLLSMTLGYAAISAAYTLLRTRTAIRRQRQREAPARRPATVRLEAAS
ncbi:heme exporter protein C (ABC transporter permease component) [Parvularcula bermudensis HTCC2503]|uniref:Heme exporter protein C n=1 Tax=Parvularcula bermudensis (strain ATCC BAA-594 / HTCC2503 / KCTC 12087) TaxID=314260 RepID=E0TI61_PARBH|nr:heme ABC transporter permease [Parvularcula bermudensis]ADM09400.1 heme exporter protein C (ABC transporter permease component) [Parvularcula bermudensis HTCC2503]